jgi:hypothetical protein
VQRAKQKRKHSVKKIEDIDSVPGTHFHVGKYRKEKGRRNFKTRKGESAGFQATGSRQAGKRGGEAGRTGMPV